MKKLYFYFLFLVPLGISAQVPTRIFNTSEITDKGIFRTEKVKAKKELNVDLTQVLKDDEREKDTGMPYRFGTAVDVNYSLDNSGEWHDIGNASVWKLQITSNSAMSLNLIFKKLIIPENGELYIYNEERTVIYGPVTSKDITPSGRFSTDVILGESIVLELLEPHASKKESVVEISKVIHGYKLFLFGDGLACNDDINCAQGNNWQDESDGIAMILLADNTRLCTGSLLNNGCQDFSPNILSAFHCADIGPDQEDPCNEADFQNGNLSAGEITQVENWVFRFLYKSPTCNGGDPHPNLYYTFQGSTFRAGNANSDAVLVEMDQRPRGDIDTGIRYLGWDRRNNVPTSGAIIGHPAGDVMKISTYNNNAITNNFPQVFGTGCQLNTNTYPAQALWGSNIVTGANEGGFSGSPLFNQNGRVVGQVLGGVAGCAPRNVWNGRLDVSWNQLRPWLTNDPNVTTTNTIPTPYMVPDVKSFCDFTSHQVRLLNRPAGHTVTWNTTPNLFVWSSDNGGIYVSYSGSGNGLATVTATISNPNTGLCPTTADFSIDIQAGRFQTGQILVSGTPGVCKGQIYTYTANVPFGHQSGYSYNWTYPSNWIFVSQSTNTIRLQTPSFSTPDGGTVRVNVNNGCGWSGFSGITVYPVCFSALQAEAVEGFNQYPNPSGKTLTVEQTDHSRDVGPYSIELYNNYGEKVTTIGTSDRKVDINTSSLPEGHYVLKIIYKEGILTRKIIVEKE